MIFAHEMFYRKEESNRNVENRLWKSLFVSLVGTSHSTLKRATP